MNITVQTRLNFASTLRSQNQLPLTVENFVPASGCFCLDVVRQNCAAEKVLEAIESQQYPCDLVGLQLDSTNLYDMRLSSKCYD